MRNIRIVTIAATCILLVSPVRAEDKTAGNVLEKMPVKEVTVFKDGHAFLLHTGKLPVDQSGKVTMDYLPQPVLGTFWPFSNMKGVKLHAVTAGQRRIGVKRTALTKRDLIEGNIGADVIVTETVPGQAGTGSSLISYRATIVDIPARSGDELEETSPPGTGEQLPQKGSVVLLKTSEGTKVLEVTQLRDITFTGAHEKSLTGEEFRNYLELTLAWPDGKPSEDADVGMLYLQRGIRWIPNYKVNIDGKGKAGVKLQATLLNEMVDLTGVSAHLVIGVPSFTFKETVDPMSLQQSVARLSQYFRRDARTGAAFGQAVMTQAARMTERRIDRPPTETVLDLGPEVTDSAKQEDLFIFSIDNITLDKGQRMVFPVADFSLDYNDVYVLDLPLVPPPQVWQNFNTNQREQVASLLEKPKVMHKIRLANKSPYPLTTAPALIMENERILSQDMMTYTAVGAESDITITAAVDIRVKKGEKELERKMEALKWSGYNYMLIDLTGKITLTNFGKEKVKVEVTRYILGNVKEAGKGGTWEMVNLYAEGGLIFGRSYPFWWYWYSWPHWWYHLNSVGRISWEVELEPKKPVDLTYSWNYYWR
jgi:hypothetical protein